MDLDGSLGGFNTRFIACTNAGEVVNSVRNGNNLGGSDNKPYRVMRKYWTDSSAAGGVSEKFTYQMPVGIRLNGSDQMAFAMECFTGSIGSPVHYVSVVYSPASGEWDYLEGSEIGPTGSNLENFTRGIRPYLVQFKS